jgi:hypothetical protein
LPLHFLQFLCHKNARINFLCSERIKQPKWQQKKILDNSEFFDFFHSIFCKIMFKNNVCVNLTTKTSKYRVEVSQLSLQCFLSFLFGLLLKKSKHIFCRKLFPVTLKNSYFEFGVEIAKKRLCKVSICFKLAFAKFWANLQI